MELRVLSTLSDAELASELARLVRCERDATARLVTHLVEFDARRLYLGAGCASLFTYCTEVLRLSEHEAYHRILAARTAGRFPRILHALDSGALNLTTVRLLAAHLTPDNEIELLAAASGKGRRDVEKLIACRFPRPDVPDAIRKLPSPPPSAPPHSTGRPLPTETPVPAGLPAAVAPRMAPALAVSTGEVNRALEIAGPSRRPPSTTQRRVVTPLAADRYQVTFTANAETCELLQQAKDLLGRAVPNADTGEVVNRALKVLVAQLTRQKHAMTERPRAGRETAPRSRHIPARVRRAVWRRDGGRCAFVARNGRRCSERRFLEYHHVDPYVLGGEATIDRMQLRCRAHNNYDAVLWGLDRRPTRVGQLGPGRVRWSRASEPAGQASAPPSSGGS